MKPAAMVDNEAPRDKTGEPRMDSGMANARVSFILVQSQSVSQSRDSMTGLGTRVALGRKKLLLLLLLLEKAVGEADGG